MNFDLNQRESIPFLLLDSPRVDNVGYSSVVASDVAHPPEGFLTSLASKAHDQLGISESYIAASHSVEQHTRGMVRKGDELLICGGAQPVTPSDSHAVLEVLVKLLKELPDGQLDTQKNVGPLLYEAKFMTELAEKFRNDPIIQDIQWKSVQYTAAAASPPMKSHPPTLRERIQRLSPIMKLVLLLVLLGSIVVVAKVAGQSRQPSTNQNLPSATIVKPKADIEKWEFLAEEEWLPVLKATDGQKLADDLPKILKDLKSKTPEQITDGETAEVKKINDINDCITMWTKQIKDEFELNSQEPQALKDAPALQALKTSGDSWFRNKLNQREKYPPELKRKAETLERFADAIPDTKDGAVGSKLLELFDALGGFAKVDGDDSLRPFREIVAKDFSSYGQPPSGYKVMTPQDVHRIEFLQRVLGSAEFGLVAYGELLPAAQGNWDIIRKRIDRGNSLAQDGKITGASASLLKALQQVFTSQSK